MSVQCSRIRPYFSLRECINGVSLTEREATVRRSKLASPEDTEEPFPAPDEDEDAEGSNDHGLMRLTHFWAVLA